DPILQEEYYQLASAVSGLGFGERVVEVPEELARLQQITAELETLRARLATIDRDARRAILAARALQESAPPASVEAAARWEFDHGLRDSVGALHGQAHGDIRFEQGALVLDGQSFVATPPL